MVHLQNLQDGIQDTSRSGTYHKMLNFRRNVEMRRKRKTVWAFLDGKKLVDVVQAALDNNMMVDDE